MGRGKEDPTKAGELPASHADQHPQEAGGGLERFRLLCDPRKAYALEAGEPPASRLKKQEPPQEETGGGLAHFRALALSMRRSPGILGRGAVEGLGDLIDTTAHDALEFKDHLVAHPKDTLGKYCKDHALDFLYGFGLSFTKLKGSASTLMVVGSLRHSIAATLDVMVNRAGDPNQKTETIKNDYRQAISREGSNFVSSFIPAMLGGYAGKATANFTFGRNLGMSDLASDRYFGLKPWEGLSDRSARPVNLPQIRENIFRIPFDRVKPPDIKLFVLDFDDTVKATKAGTAHGLQSNIETLSKDFGLPEEQVTHSLGTVVSAARNLTHPYIIEESPLRAHFEGSDADFHDQHGQRFYQNMENSLGLHGGLFPGAAEAIDGLKNLSPGKAPAKVVLLSNGRINDVKPGVEENGLGPHFDAVYCQPKAEPVNKDLPDSLRGPGDQRVNAAMSMPETTRYVILDPREAKPSGIASLKIMAEQGVLPKNTMEVGNSRIIDGREAHKAGTPFVHVVENLPEEAEKLIGDLNKAGPTIPAVTKKHYPPLWATVNSITELRDLLTPGKALSIYSRQILATLPRWQSTFAGPLVDSTRPVLNWLGIKTEQDKQP